MNETKSTAALVAGHQAYPLLSTLTALLICGLVMAMWGYNPFTAFGAILVGAFGGRQAMLNTLVLATPLMFRGLAFVFAKKAGMFNVGIIGQIHMGALGAALVGLLPLGIPSVIHVTAALLAGVAFGGAYAAIIGFMRTRIGNNVIICSIFLNFIAILLVDFLAGGPLMAEGSALAQTEKMAESAQLGRLFADSQLTGAFLMAVAACLAMGFVMERTVLGYEMRAVGHSAQAAETAGIRVNRTLILAMVISGCIAGLGGGTHVLGVDMRLHTGFLPGSRFEGLAVAGLSMDRPLGVILAAIFFGALRSGVMELNRTTGIPTEFMGLLEALVILLVGAPLLLQAIYGVKPTDSIRQAGAERDGEQVPNPASEMKEGAK